MKPRAWQALGARERLALGAGLAALVAFAAYLGAAPLLQSRADMAARLPGLREDLAWMQQHLAEAQRLYAPAAAAGAGTRPLTPAAIEDALRTAQLLAQVSELRPASNGQVLVAFDEVDHAALVRLLWALGGAAAIRIEDAQVSAVAAKPGTVAARILVSGT